MLVIGGGCFLLSEVGIEGGCFLMGEVPLNRGISLIIKRHPLEPYSRHMRRALWRPLVKVPFLLSEVPL